MTRRRTAAVLLALLPALAAAPRLAADPVPEEVIVAESDAIVVGRVWTVFALPGPLVTRGVSLLHVERPVFGRTAEGEWLFFSWAYHRYDTSCPPGTDFGAASGHLVLWFLRLDGKGGIVGVPQGWSLESRRALEQREDYLAYMAAEGPLSERLAAVEQVVREQLAELRARED